MLRLKSHVYKSTCRCHECY